MSVEKKLATLANSKSIIDTFANSQMSLLRKNMAIKGKEIFQVSSDRETTVTNAGFGQQGHYRMRETFYRNMVLELALPAGTYQLPRNWGLRAVDSLRELIGGEQEIVKSGWANHLQTYRECQSEEARIKYELLSGDAVTNPTGTIYAYVFLNVGTGSINPHMAQYLPAYQLNASPEYQIKFSPWSDVAIAGAQQNFVSARVFFEYASPLRQRDLRPKFAVPAKEGEAPKKAGEEQVFHEIVSYEYNLPANGSVNRAQLLRSFPLSEIDELVFIHVADTEIATNKNNLNATSVTNIKVQLSDREIIDAKNSFQSIKQLFRNNLPNTYNAGGAERDMNVLDLTPLNYKEQETSRVFIQGVILSEEDVNLTYDVPTDVAGKLYIYGVKKVLLRYTNGNLQRFY